MQSFLTTCHQIEDLARQIYQTFANNESFADDVRQVFRQLSDDERTHARHLDLVRQASVREMEALPRMTWDKLSEALQVAERMLRVVEREALDEERALRMAIEMENRFVKVHAQNVLHFNNQKLAKLFDTLGSDDQAHLDTLRKCLGDWLATRKPS